VGAALNTDNSKIIIDQCTISGNTVGGGLYLIGASGVTDQPAIIANSNIFGNSGLNGGGIYAYQVALNITNSKIYSNFASMGGGAFIQSLVSRSYPIVFNNVQFFNNSALESGAGLYGFQTYLSINNSLFEQNSCLGATSNGGAIYLEGESSNCFNMTITNTEFIGNKASAYGGAIYTQSAIFGLNRITMTANFATGGNGGAIAVNQAGFICTSLLQNTTIGANRAANMGGAIWMNNAKLSTSNSNIYQNSAGSSGGAIWSEDSFLSVDQSNLTNNFLNSSYLTNTNSSNITDTFRGKGACIAFHKNSLSLTNSNISGNYGATLGGALYYLRASSLATVQDQAFISNCQFISNSALLGNGSGGALVFDATPSVTSSILSRQAASTQNPLTVQSSTFDQNQSNQNGASLLVLSAPMLVSDSIFSQNSVTSNPDFGHDVFSSSSSLTLINTVFQGQSKQEVGCQSGQINVIPSSPTDFSSSSSGICNSGSSCTFNCLNCTLSDCEQPSSSSSGTNNATRIAIPIIVFLLLVALVVGLIFLHGHKAYKSKRRPLPHENMFGLENAFEFDTWRQRLRDHSDTMMQENSLILRDIKIEGLIGGGAFGRVFKGVWNGTTPVALKSLVGGMDKQQEFLREAGLLFKLNHPNIVRALGIYRKTDQEFFLVLEYCKMGSLDRFLQNADTAARMSVTDRIKMCTDVAAGCKYMEQQGVVHRDLGARNLLVTEIDGEFVIKVSNNEFQ
jgi:predicted outer membrane repeat protein